MSKAKLSDFAEKIEAERGAALAPWQRALIDKLEDAQKSGKTIFWPQRAGKRSVLAIVRRAAEAKAKEEKR